MKVAWVCLLAAAASVRTPGAEEPAAVAARCTEETVQLLSLPCTADEPCPLFLELAAIEAVANRLVITGNLHTGSTTLESILLTSDDTGRSWTEAHPRIPGAVLDQVQFLDFEVGWINGHLLQGTPRDPFFLLTTDGGKTWRRRPISGESRTGTVEQFWFDSRTHGLLTIDRVRAPEGGLRYEIWESMTGAESWSVRQVNHSPLSIPRPKADPIWRIRGDGPAKLHRIEKREGDRWTTVASLAIAAGECRPAPAELKEPPPPPTATETPPAEEPAAPKSRPSKPPSLKRDPPQ